MMIFLRRFIASAPIRTITFILIRVSRGTGRIASFMRTRALFPSCLDVYCHWSTEITYPERITVGKRVVIGPKCTIGGAAGIYIGDDVLLSKGVFVHTGMVDTSRAPPFFVYTGTDDTSTAAPYKRLIKPVRIESGVWLGAYSMVLAGVTIGANSIVGAGVVVRKSVPPGSFVLDATTRVQPRRAYE
jgi:acetyltransferase-like isoleucine patch superfamily enzyme